MPALAELRLVAALLATLPAAMLSAQDTGQVRTGQVLVVAESTSAASLELASCYRRLHHLPPMNLLTVTAGNPITIAPAEFQERLLKPLQQRLKLLGPGMETIVLCRDVPYRVGDVSLATAVMFGSAAEIPAQNPWYQVAAAPSASARFYPCAWVTGQTVDDALAMLRRAQARYDDARRAGRFYFCEGTGPRGMRNPQIPAALAALRAFDARADHVREAQPRGRDDILGLFTGAERVSLAGNAFVPGAVVDNLTSFGGCLLDPRGQTSVLEFIRHGASAAYGTVSEPGNSPERWASCDLPARYLTGASIMDCYLRSVRDWRFSLLVADPLMAPFARHLAPQPLTTAADPAGPDEPLAVRIRVAPLPGERTVTAELWLNDQHRVWTFAGPLQTLGREQVVALPPENCAAGDNRLLLLVREAAGPVAATAVIFTVARPGFEATLRVETPVASLHSALRLGLESGAALAQACPELCIDGRVMQQWPAGTRQAAYRLSIPLVAPGPHDVWVQYVREPGPRSPLLPYVPLARTAAQTLFVRRPLHAGLTFTPREAPADRPVRLEFRGPYLRDGLTLSLNSQDRHVPVTLARDPDNGLVWRSDPLTLPSGPYRLDIAGDPATETPGSPLDLFIATAPEAKR